MRLGWPRGGSVGQGGQRGTLLAASEGAETPPRQASVLPVRTNGGDGRVMFCQARSCIMPKLIRIRNTVPSFTSLSLLSLSRSLALCIYPSIFPSHSLSTHPFLLR